MEETRAIPYESVTNHSSGGLDLFILGGLEMGTLMLPPALHGKSLLPHFA